MVKISNQEKLHPFMGVALFAVVMGAVLTLGAYMQRNWGMVGLVTTEIMFVIIALIFCVIRKIDIKEMFPVRKIRGADVLGCLLIHIGAFLLSMLSTLVVGILFPSTLKVADALNSFIFGGMPFIVTFLIVAVLPAICEEAIHRGAILSCFRSIKKDWVIVLIMAVFFGLFHIYPIKFMSTAILGGALSFVLVKKNNILLPMLMHFCNNAFSVIVSYASGSASGGSSASLSGTNLMPALGAYLILGCAAPLLMVLGAKLLRPDQHKKKRFMIAGIMTAALLAAGIVVTVFGAGNSYLNCTIGYDVTEDKMEYQALDFDIEQDTQALVVVSLSDAGGDYTVRIDGDKGSNIINAPVPKGNARMFWYRCDFQADHYRITFVADDNAVGETPNFSIVIQ